MSFLRFQFFFLGNGFSYVYPLERPIALPSPFPLREDIVQLHVFGGEDRVSPAAIGSNALRNDARAGQLLIEAADHVCCWVREWSRIREVFGRTHRSKRQPTPQQRIDSSERMRSSSSLR